MLEFNLYENFNPNLNLPWKQKVPKARGTIMNYELWQTGYKFTSTGVLSVTANVGDVVEILINSDYSYATVDYKSEKVNLSMLFVVIDIDDSNKATLKNYFWAMVDGVDVPTSILSQSSLNILKLILNQKTIALVTDGIIVNESELSKVFPYNRKSETDSAENILKDMFRFLKKQPITIFKNNKIQTLLVSQSWNRAEIKTRIDEKQNIAIENEVITDRSNYNFLNAYIKKDDGTYPTSPNSYTISDTNVLINMANYSGDGTDLPDRRLIKTGFFDKQPTDAEIKFQISKDTTVANLYFNQNDLLPLYTNDLVNVYYQGLSYRGYIADRCFVESDNGVTNERLLFVQGVS